jgi:tRNA(Ile)-lysidine synthase
VNDAAADKLLGRCRFPPAGTAAVCAVSGGADSLALMVLAGAAGCDVTAVHVDHGLRKHSADEADVVAAAAERFGARFEAHRVVVAPGPNVEARARAARYRVLPPDVLTGHTADDQAETVLLNLMRGAGLDGLRGLPVERRPLIAIRRADTHALCRALGLEPVADPTNDDRSLRRNRVRHELLPMLDVIAGRDVAPVVARQAELLSDDAALLDALSEVIDPSDVKALQSAPLPLARRAIRAWLRCDSDAEHHPPDAATVERVLAVARGEAKGSDIGGGRRVVRSRGRLTITP